MKPTGDFSENNTIYYITRILDYTYTDRYFHNTDPLMLRNI